MRSLLYKKGPMTKAEVERAFQRYEEEQQLEKKYLVKNHLVINSEKNNLLNEIKTGIESCERFYFSVAFINYSGLQLLLDSLKEAEEQGKKGCIISSTYLNFTEPKALKRLQAFSNIELKVFEATEEKGFHTKAYVFENKETYRIIIGSSNITQRALKSNIEWNVLICSKKNDVFATSVIEEYKKLWEITSDVDEAFLERYRTILKKMRQLENKKQELLEEYQIIRPNSMQTKAVQNLQRLRAAGEKKALVIAATGTGKTYMSAFDVEKVQPGRMLFLVHREEILKAARDTFMRLRKNKSVSMGFLTGTEKDFHAQYLFSTVQSMNNHYLSFQENAFDYIVVDEAHHATSPIYQKIVSHFNPDFLLGMTATPERCDDGNIFDVFENNIALEIRLHEALKEELLVPFHYFGITDIEEVNFQGVKLENVSEVANRLKINKRVDYIIEKMDFYGHDGEKRKALGFCANIDHALYMTTEFTKRGIECCCMTGENAPKEREEAVLRLEDPKDPLEVIFTVDIFNEGIDIPSINLVLMLRPTNSPIIFIQQLGRGLRKHNSKEFLTVLDFIGNHDKAFLIALALNGARYYDKDSLKVAVKNEFPDLGGCSHIQMDRISQERILGQITVENFYSMKYLKEEYKEFKKDMGKEAEDKIPYSLMDYIRFDGAPDPLKFIEKEKTYLGFLAKMEKETTLGSLLDDEVFEKVLRELSSRLPLKRIYEFMILRYLLDHVSISLVQAKNEISKLISDVQEEDIFHAFRALNQDFFDEGQRRTNIKCVELREKVLWRSHIFHDLIQKEEPYIWIADTLNYGIARYEAEFGNENYGRPFFKLYEQYQMIDAALLSNYEKTHSAFRGSGLLTNGKEFFLFIDLHKGEDVKESINYKDKFISERDFQWQTPNSTSQDSERGRNIIFNKARGINLHIFVRKYKELDGKSQPYIYIGKGNSIPEKAAGNKPITIQLQLEQEIPQKLYRDLTEVVN